MCACVQGLVHYEMKSNVVLVFKNKMEAAYIKLAKQTLTLLSLLALLVVWNPQCPLSWLTCHPGPAGQTLCFLCFCHHCSSSSCLPLHHVQELTAWLPVSVFRPTREVSAASFHWLSGVQFSPMRQIKNIYKHQELNYQESCGDQGLHAGKGESCCCC